MAHERIDACSATIAPPKCALLAKTAFVASPVTAPAPLHELNGFRPEALSMTSGARLTAASRTWSFVVTLFCASVVFGCDLDTSGSVPQDAARR